MYEGRLTIDINNTTFTTISGATLEYELIDKVVKLPQIKPLERLIVIAPTGVSDKPLKTRVFINYNGESKEILGEYYTLSGNKYNTDIMQCTKIKIKHKGIVVQRNNMFNVKSYINLKPYLRIIDMDSIDV